MRRITAFAGTAAVLTPLLLMNAGSASAAASSSLTVSTIGRDGRSVSSRPQAVNVKTHDLYYLTSGKAAKLPKGSYDVIVDVFNTRDGTDTLGAKRVTVSGGSKTTIDARQGHAVKAALSPAAPSGYDQLFTVDLCTTEGSGDVGAWAGTGTLFVIPSSLSTVELAYGSTWTPGSGDGRSPVYVGAGVHKKGLPSGLSTTFHQSSLASLKVTARRGPETGRSNVEITRNSSDTCQASSARVDATATLPYGFTAHLTGGSWQVSETADDFVYGPTHQYSAGKSYGITLNRAVWGPSGGLPYTWGSGHRLYFGDIGMFTDPVLGTPGTATTTYKLTKAGKSLSTKSHQPVIKSAGWYTLTESATRHPLHKLAADASSSKATVSMHFYADPKATEQVRGYLTRFTPVALDSSDRARPGATTTIDLGMLRNRSSDPEVRQLSDTAKKVRVWASFDGGRTWHAQTVKHPGGTWTTTVHDPKSGTVSLRSTVDDSHGDSTTTTVVNAYTVS
ncbi:hypothetical protein AB0399_38945 [Streptomyces sp. NPDC088194]|uniref:hypothetical protein n=1 Tax=Streptomyces sp. NPDC088194 TaxID=3154931 RepID=UPI00345093C8